MAIAQGKSLHPVLHLPTSSVHFPRYIVAAIENYDVWPVNRSFNRLPFVLAPGDVSFLIGPKDEWAKLGLELFNCLRSRVWLYARLGISKAAAGCRQKCKFSHFINTHCDLQSQVGS